MDSAHALEFEAISGNSQRTMNGAVPADLEFGTAAENGQDSKKEYGSSWTMQYVILFRRAIKVRRFEALAIQDLVQFVGLGILAGALFTLPRHLARPHPTLPSCNRQYV